MNDLITSIEASELLNISMDLEGVLKLFNRIDWELEIYFQTGDHRIIKKTYDDLGCSISKITEIVKILKDNRELFEASNRSIENG